MRCTRICLLALAAAWLGGCSSTHRPPDSISGLVRDDSGPLAGATVRVRATDWMATSDQQGRFTLRGVSSDEPLLITAWATGYYIGGGDRPYRAGEDAVEVVLTRHASEDHADYRWVSAFRQPGVESGNCVQCHASSSETSTQGAPTVSGRSGWLPFDEWIQDAHGLSTQNPRFMSMYLGQDLQGRRSPPTDYGYSRDYGRFPLRPDPGRPYFGPGYRLDYPDSAGNCAACHAPTAAVQDPYGTDPSQVGDVGAEGAACDFCHKIWDVRLNPATGLPYPNMPGVLSFEFRRPPPGHQFFAGPLDDVAPGEDTYSPLQTQSHFCAPCHYGVFWGTLVYNSFGEWLDSPYSDPESGKTCQDCHMPSSGIDHFARLDKGGLVRRPETIASHLMPGASDPGLLQHSVTMQVEAQRVDGTVAIGVTITNDLTGHAVPTDSPLRHMILVVEATSGTGESLKLLDGPRLPAWCGIGDPSRGYLAGQPGRAYARVLQEKWTEVAPTGAYWNPTRVISDNRLAPYASDATRYVFEDPGAGSPLSLEVRLLFRRAFIGLMDQKSWEVPDIVMEEEQISFE